MEVSIVRLDGNPLTYSDSVKNWPVPTNWSSHIEKMKFEFIFYRPFRDEGLLISLNSSIPEFKMCAPREWSSNIEETYNVSYNLLYKNGIYLCDSQIKSDGSWSITSERLIFNIDESFKLGLQPKIVDSSQTDVITKVIDVLLNIPAGLGFVRLAELYRIELYSFLSFENRCIYCPIENSVTIFHIKNYPDILESTLMLIYTLRMFEQEYIGLALPTDEMESDQRLGRTHAKCVDATIWSIKVAIELAESYEDVKVDLIMKKYGLASLWEATVVGKNISEIYSIYVESGEGPKFPFYPQFHLKRCE